MIVYHLSWDLSWFGFVGWPVSIGAGWELFSKSIASSFLFLSGASLVLAHGGGIRWPAFWKREAVIVVAALAVSVATYFAFGEIFVRFGILHSIAAGSLIALPFVRLPAVFSLAAAALFFSLPHWAGMPFFDGQWWLWTGLGNPSFGSVDYVPLAPWTSATLLGVALMKLPGVRTRLARLNQLRPWPLLGRLLIFCGRKSLAIYLLHQPILYGLVWAAAAAGFAPDNNATAFQQNCTASCEAARGTGVHCAEICACTLSALQSDGTWSALMKDPENPDHQRIMNDRYAACSVDPETFQPANPAR